MNDENLTGSGSGSTTPTTAPMAPAAAEKLRFSEILSDAWQLTAAKFWNLLGIYLFMTAMMVVVVIIAGTAAVLAGFLLSLTKIPALLALFIILAVIAIFILILWIATWMTVASFRYLDRSDNPTVREMIMEAKPMAWALIPTMLITILTVLGGYMALVIPGIVMAVSLGFVWNVISLEDKKLWPALQRSRDLVRGRWWNIFLIWLAFGILACIVLLATGGSYSPLMIIIYPFSYVLSHVAYKKLNSLTAAATPTNRGDWYYKAAAALGALGIIAVIAGLIIAAGSDWDGFKKKFEDKAAERGNNSLYAPNGNMHFEYNLPNDNNNAENIDLMTPDNESSDEPTLEGGMLDPESAELQ